MRILVTGGLGMVGSYVESVFHDAECFLTDFQTLDVCDAKRVLNTVQEVMPGIILHLAAATNVDKCELEPHWAYETNVEATRNVAIASKRYNVILVFLSSGAVFDGAKAMPYTEFDRTCPISIYGKTKLEAEKIIMATLQDYFIVRAGWMVGGGKKDVKFVGKIVQRMLESNSVNVVNDKFGSLTYAKDLLAGIKNLLIEAKPGLYHMVNQGMVSRYDIALEIKRILSLTDIRISPVSSDSFPLPAPRGRCEAMENFRLNELNLNYMRDWRQALQDYLLNDFSLDLNKEDKP